MLKQHQSNMDAAQVAVYTPVARRDVMTSAHIEDFLDHHFAPLIGAISYEERQQQRLEMQQQILSLVAAHMELGSGREEAIALALGSLTPPATATVKVAQRTRALRTPVAQTTTGVDSLKPALISFGASSLAALLLAATTRNAVGNDVTALMGLVLFVFPFLAGASLGARSTRNPFKELVTAQLILYAPLTIAMYWIIGSSGGHPEPILLPALATLTYTAIGSAVGSVGVQAGKWLKQKFSRR